MIPIRPSRILVTLLALTLAIPFVLTGCVPALVVAGVGGPALVATDRRSVGAQADDEAIELKIAEQINTRYGERVHAISTSYNGIVLLSGEVPDFGTLASIGNLAKNTERVRAVHNELAVGPNRVTATRLGDARYHEVAAGFGCGSAHITRIEQLEPAIHAAFASGRPFCLNVEVDLAPIPPELYLLMQR